MKQKSSREAHNPSASLQFTCILYSPKVHYLFHNSPPLVNIMTTINKVHTRPSHFFKIHFNLILPSWLGLPRSLSTHRFTTKDLQAPDRLPAHLISLDLIQIIFSEDCRLHQKMFPISPVVSALSDPNISLSTLFSNIHRLRSYFSVRGSAPHLHKTTAKNVFLYILVFVFVETKSEGNRFQTDSSRHFLDIFIRASNFDFFIERIWTARFSKDLMVLRIPNSRIEQYFILRWQPTNVHFFCFLHIRTVQHLDITNVLFIHQLMH